MNYQQLDQIADLCNPLFIVVLVWLTVATLKIRAGDFLLRSGLAVVAAQQLSKFAQKKAFWGEDFPSTHFAVALALCVSLVILKRRLWPLALAYLLGYGALILVQNYHTPTEMLGSLFAIPLALLFHFKFRKARVAAN